MSKTGILYLSKFAEFDGFNEPSQMLIRRRAGYWASDIENLTNLMILYFLSYFISKNIFLDKGKNYVSFWNKKK